MIEPVIFANVGRDGVIVFEPHADPSLGRLPVGSASSADARRFKEIVSVNARHAYDGVTLLVPGIPEANNDDEAMDRLLYFRRLVEMRMNGEKGWPPLPASAVRP